MLIEMYFKFFVTAGSHVPNTSVCSIDCNFFFDLTAVGRNILV